MSDAGALSSGGDLRRWTASLVVVLAAHAAGGAGLLVWRTPADSPMPASAVMIDLTPLPEPAPATPAETAADPAPPELPAEPPPPEPPPPEPEPIPEPIPEPLPEPIPDLQPPPVPAPEVAVAMPPPRSKPRPPERPPPAAKPATAKPAEPRPPVSQPAPPAVAAAPAPAPAASAPSGAVRSWQGVVLAHLERHKRYPRAAQARRQQGIAHVRFVVDRQGRVLSRSLEKASGVAALDEETLALVERADPLPAPPPDMAQSRIELVVPVVYAIK